jgi:hypothetical protein
MQAYVQKTNSTMQQAAAEMAALRQEAQGAAAGTGAGDAQPELSQAGTAASLNSCMQEISASSDSSSSEVPETAGETSDAAQDSSLGEAASGTGRGPDAADGGSASSGGCPYIGFSASSNFLDAQSLWDATMAFSIAEHFTQQHTSSQRQDSRAACSSSSRGSAAAGKDEAGESSTALASSVAAAAGKGDRGPSGAASGPAEAGSAAPLVVHVCGKFHSEGGYGITEHLAQYAPALRVLVVTFVPTWECVEVGEEAFRRDRLGLYGNFVVLTDLRLPRSFEVEHPL